MREIKFRAWDDSKKKFYYLDVKRDYQFARHLYHYGNGVSWEVEGNPIINFNPNHPMMQYTGLKDKNGVEIFEGDIMDAEVISEIDCEGDCEIVGYWATVEFHGGSFVLMRDGDVIDFDSFEDQISGLKIIGNIYENPELLKLEERDESD